MTSTQSFPPHHPRTKNTGGRIGDFKWQVAIGANQCDCQTREDGGYLVPATAGQGCDSTGSGEWRDVFSGRMAYDPSPGAASTAWASAIVPRHRGRCFRLYMSSSLGYGNYHAVSELQLKITGASVVFFFVFWRCSCALRLSSALAFHSL